MAGYILVLKPEAREKMRREARQKLRFERWQRDWAWFHSLPPNTQEKLRHRFETDA